MTLALTYLIVWIIGFVLYALSVWFPKPFAWLGIVGLILFAIGFWYWLPGNHAASIR